MSANNSTDRRRFCLEQRRQLFDLMYSTEWGRAVVEGSQSHQYRCDCGFVCIHPEQIWDHIAKEHSQPAPRQMEMEELL